MFIYSIGWLDMYLIDYEQNVIVKFIEYVILANYQFSVVMDLI